MAITGLKTWVSGDELNTTNLNNDKTILEAKFNGGITSSDINSSAGILATQLAQSYFEIPIHLSIEGTELNSAAATNIFTAGRCAQAIPVEYNIATTTTYYLVGGTVNFYEGSGGAAPGTAATYTLHYGTLAVPGTSLATINIPTTTGCASAIITGSVVVPAYASAQKFFFLRQGTQGVGYAAGDIAVVSFFIKRQLRG